MLDGGTDGGTVAFREAFRADGFAVAARVFADGEVRAMQRECDRLWALRTRLDPEDPRFQYRAGLDGCPRLDRVDPVLDLSPAFTRIAEDRRVVALAEAALGAPATLLKDKLIFKFPGTCGYGLHQDFPYWDWSGLAADALMTISVAIDPAGPDNGGLELYPGRHLGRLPQAADDPRDADPASVDPAGFDLPRLAAGDVLAFHSLAPHRSGPNGARIARRVLDLTFAATPHTDARARFYDRYRAEPSLAAAGARRDRRGA